MVCDFWVETDVIIICRNKKTIRSVAGLIEISPLCKLTTKQFEISTNIDNNSDQRKKIWNKIKVFNINNISEHEMINDRQYKNFMKLNKTLEILQKTIRKISQSWLLKIQI